MMVVVVVVVVPGLAASVSPLLRLSVRSEGEMGIRPFSPNSKAQPMPAPPAQRAVFVWLWKVRAVATGNWNKKSWAGWLYVCLGASIQAQKDPSDIVVSGFQRVIVRPCNAKPSENKNTRRTKTRKSRLLKEDNRNKRKSGRRTGSTALAVVVSGSTGRGRTLTDLGMMEPREPLKVWFSGRGPVSYLATVSTA